MANNQEAITNNRVFIRNILPSPICISLIKNYGLQKPKWRKFVAGINLVFNQR